LWLTSWRRRETGGKWENREVHPIRQIAFNDRGNNIAKFIQQDICNLSSDLRDDSKQSARFRLRQRDAFVGGELDLDKGYLRDKVIVIWI